MTALSKRRLQGIALLLASFLSLSGLAYAAWTPLSAAEEELAAMKAQIRLLQSGLARAGALPAVDVSNAIRFGSSEVNSPEIQRLLVEASRKVGLSQLELRTLPERSLDRGLVQVCYGLVLMGDLDQWARFMEELARIRPAVFVDKLVLSAGSGFRGDLAMRIEIEVSAYTNGKATQ